MAPTSPIKRVTRARAAAKPDDNNTTTAKKVGTAKVTKATAAKSTTCKTHANDDDGMDDVSKPEPSKKTTRPMKAMAPVAPPRRRIKVTPLDVPVVEEPVQHSDLEKPKKKTTTRSKKVVDVEAIQEGVEKAPTTTRSRSTKGSSTIKKSTSKTEPEISATKTRGKSKKTAQPEEDPSIEPKMPKSTRQTRARSASVASQQAIDTVEVAAKPKTATRKKVTFQDLLEDEKENEDHQPRKTATRKASSATGMRAKPVRKPAAAATAKNAPVTRGRVAKLPGRALTPKKVTQVARASTPDDSEDELNGAKTPVRDLTLSPKRNANIAALLSPSKKLDFGQTLLARSPQKVNDGASLLSPARRPTSPAKDGNVQQEGLSSVSLSAGHALLQSPKRGIVDSSVFPASANKAQRSPLKESLLQSPARRLFSPAKSKTPLSFHRDAENHPSMEAVEEIAVSSHFRPSMSLQRSARVYKMSDEELADELAMDMDFDQSVLKLTSPKKSPVKSLKPDFAAMLSTELQMSTIQNDAEETAKAVEELQTSEPSTEQDQMELVEPKNTIQPAQMSISVTDDSTTEDETIEQRPTMCSKAPRLSQILFRTNRINADDESSEDELVADQTPARAPRLFRSSLTDTTNPRSRLSMAVQGSVHRNVGFTPLAAQMSGWLANSPDKTTAKSGKKQTSPVTLFSPLAGQHVAGEIQISRQATPQQLKSSPAFNTSISSRPSFGVSNMGSPERSTFFAEQMASMNEEDIDQVPVEDVDMFDVARESTTPGQIAAENDVLRAELQKDCDSAISVEQDDDDTVIVTKAPEEITTDLVNQMNASETAMLDFQELAYEAESLADADESGQDSSSESVYGDENVPPLEPIHFDMNEEQASPEEHTLNLHVIEKGGAAAEEPTLNLHVIEQSVEGEDTIMATPAGLEMGVDESALNLHILEQNPEARSPSATTMAVDFSSEHDPAMHFDLSEQIAPARSASSTPAAQHETFDETTLNFQLLEQDLFEGTPAAGRVVETHVDASPEGSPPPTALPVKLVQTESDMITPRAALAGPRVVNTVISKVPLKPAADVSPIKMPKKRSRSMSMSRGQSPPKRPHLSPLGELAARSMSYPAMSPDRSAESVAPSPALTTPGQVSFAVDDFGDSTLDGIELPDDELEFDAVGARCTPATLKSVKTIKSAAPTPTRSPLKSVGEGVLHGAVIYVEVHTSEGADASGVYVDLLTQMGARCVRDWRWNPRASVHGGDELVVSGKPGITHVVYKDGGKRTLEKVRDAKGEVWCVGVRWVLDCERSQAWVEEGPYVVDQNILSRGGSRRRKSMEPKTLINANGNISTARSAVGPGRRSTSAEFMTTQMRDELINTPVRTYQPPAPRASIGGESMWGDSDISSTYNSPTTTMNVHHVATPTELVGWDPATSKTPAKADGDGVDVDTPYLMKQGGMVMEHLLGRDDGGVMSAPPKQTGKGLFDDDSNDGGVKDTSGGATSKEQMKMKLKLQEARRRTMGFKPIVGSPLGKF